MVRDLGTPLWVSARGRYETYTWDMMVGLNDLKGEGDDLPLYREILSSLALIYDRI